MIDACQKSTELAKGSSFNMKVSGGSQHAKSWEAILDYPNCCLESKKTEQTVNSDSPSVSLNSDITIA